MKTLIAHLVHLHSVFMSICTKTIFSKSKSKKRSATSIAKGSLSQIWKGLLGLKKYLSWQLVLHLCQRRLYDFYKLLWLWAQQASARIKTGVEEMVGTTGDILAERFPRGQSDRTYQLPCDWWLGTALVPSAWKLWPPLIPVSKHENPLRCHEYLLKQIKTGGAEFRASIVARSFHIMSCDRLVFYRFHIAISYAGEMLKLEDPPHHPLLHHKHVCTSTYDRPDFFLKFQCQRSFKCKTSSLQLTSILKFSHNHGSVYGCVWKVTISLEIHPFFTEPWLWEEG